MHPRESGLRLLWCRLHRSLLGWCGARDQSASRYICLTGSGTLRQPPRPDQFEQKPSHLQHIHWSLYRCLSMTGS
jgi:hypothetical protein